jgi:hypothetical protein
VGRQNPISIIDQDKHNARVIRIWPLNPRAMDRKTNLNNFCIENENERKRDVNSISNEEENEQMQ